MGFEIVEQLGWRYPKHLVSPVAGGTLLPRIVRGFRELREIGLVDGELPRDPRGAGRRLRAGRARARSGPRPSRAGAPEHDREVDRDRQSRRRLSGDPERAGHRRHRRGRVTTTQIVDAIQLLAETEGIFTEPAGGTTLAATIDLIARGVIPRDESIVVCVTGNGYKTAEVVADRLDRAGAPEPRVQGIRSVATSRARRSRSAGRSRDDALRASGRELRGDVELETIGSLNSIARPLRSTLTVAVDPIFASATSRKNCDGSSIGWPLKPTMTSPGRRPAS